MGMSAPAWSFPLSFQMTACKLCRSWTKELALQVHTFSERASGSQNHQHCSPNTWAAASWILLQTCSQRNGSPPQRLPCSWKSDPRVPCHISLPLEKSTCSQNLEAFVQPIWQHDPKNSCRCDKDCLEPTPSGCFPHFVMFGHASRFVSESGRYIVWKSKSNRWPIFRNSSTWIHDIFASKFRNLGQFV